jgi:hypothetical protein
VGHAATVEDFDAGDPCVGDRCHVFPEGAAAPEAVDGGPTGSGRFLRLGTIAPLPNQKTITFDRSDLGRYGQVVVDFDFRMTEVAGRADGLGMALLDTTLYGAGGKRPPSDPFASEDPYFEGSLGIGFDVYRSDDLGDIGELVGPPGAAAVTNHVSVHFNYFMVGQVDLTPFGIDLLSGEWIHAQVVLRATAPFRDVSVTLTPYADGIPRLVVDGLPVPGLVPYESRVWFGARVGGAQNHHDIDNVNAVWSDPQPAGAGEVAFPGATVTAVESATNEVLLAVQRTGGQTGAVTVDWATTPGSADADVDYASSAGTVAFADGETLAVFPIGILDDVDPEGDETFTVTLSNPGGGAALGAVTTATVSIADPDDDPPAQVGSWSPPVDWGIVAIHSCLLPTGKVVLWEDRGQTDEVLLWDPATPAAPPVPAGSPGYDIFCAGHNLTAGGGMLVTGGHNHTDGEGLVEATVYDPVGGSWTPIPPMSGPRWYPSNTATADGDVLVTSGSLHMLFFPNPRLDVWQPALGAWRTLTAAQMPFPLYPFMFPAPDGRIFAAGPQQVTGYLDTSGAGSWTPLGRSTFGYRDYGSAVQLDDTVMLVGGTDDPGRNARFRPTATAELIDLASPTPAWTPTGSMAFERRHHSAVALPDGRVLVMGGSSSPRFNERQGAVLAPEVWDPTSGQWTLLAPGLNRRLYHSGALLMPDGQILVLGSGEPEAAGEPPQENFELYAPPYLFQGPRPVITNAPASIDYATVFGIDMPGPDAATATRVSLVRLPCVTHGFDQNQRLVTLAFTPRADGLDVDAPATPEAALPGHYMLFVVGAGGVPSVARIVRLGAGLPTTTTTMPPLTTTTMMMTTTTTLVTTTTTFTTTTTLASTTSTSVTTSTTLPSTTSTSTSSTSTTLPPSSCDAVFGLERARVTVKDAPAPTGDERLRLSGVLPWPAGTPSVFDPATQGMHVRVTDLGRDGAVVLDLDPVPPGAPGTGCAPEDGWRKPKKPGYRNTSGSIDPPTCTPGSAQGLRMIALRDKRAKGGGVTMKLATRRANLGAPVGPLRVRVAIGDACAQASFAPAMCRPKGASLRCR